MMRALVALCVRHSGAVTALTVLALLLGSWGALHSPLDVFPEFVPSQVDIQTEASGFAPQQVEELVTKPIENAVNGTAGLATLRSESIPGLSVVTITFARNLDVHVARQGIAERLAELGSTLPAGVGTPKLSPLVSSTMDLLKIGLLSDKVDAYTLRDAANWVIKPRLLAVPGVAHVIVFGGDQRQIQILPDIARLASYNVTISEVADAARTALPLRGAGFIDLASQRILIKSPTPAPDIAALSAAVVTVRNNTPILLRDLAEVKVAPALRFGDALIMGKPGVLLSLASQYGANTLATTLAVERALAALEPALARERAAGYAAPAPRDHPRGISRGAGTGDLRDRGRGRGLPAGAVHHERTGTLRRAAGARVHIRGARIARSRDDLDAGTVRVASAASRGAPGGGVAAASEKLAALVGGARQPAPQGLDPGARRARHRCPRCAGVSRRHLHAGLPRGTFRDAGVELDHRHLARADAGARQAREHRGAGAAVRQNHRAADRTRGAERGYVGSAPQ